MTELTPTTKHLGELNSSRFFCPCGMGERDHCPGYHVEREKEVRASHKRSMLIITAMGLIAVIVYAFTWVRG